ncbi:MAG: glycerophosphodiester phosphodiesterase [Clostridia bacterium]|nr:glycerophosphodiester phosphodiesterase [Clostridia bacterium]
MKKITKIFIALVALVVIVTAAILGYHYIEFRKAVLPMNFTLTAHTGCEETQENSLESIRKGYESGADIVEFDLNFTTKGEAVLSHDEVEGDCVTLDAAFALISDFPNIKANVDCKSVSNLKTVTELAEKHNISDRIFYSGIREEDVPAVKEQTPEVAYWLNYDVDVKKNTDEEYLLSLARKTRELGAVGLNINYETCTKELVEIFHREGLLVSIWTVNKTQHMISASNLGADNITTRKPSQLREIVELKQTQ